MAIDERLTYADGRKAAGNAAVGKGDVGSAEAEYREALRYLRNLGTEAGSSFDTAEQRERARVLTAAVNGNLAMVLIKQSRWHEAVSIASEAVAMDPTNAKYLSRRGIALGHDGQPARAKADLTAALKLAPSDAAIKAELDRINAIIAKSERAEKAAFGGMFSRGGGVSLYDEKAPPPSAMLSYKGPLPRVYFDVTIGGESKGRIVMRLFKHVTPRTVENFRA